MKVFGGCQCDTHPPRGAVRPSGAARATAAGLARKALRQHR